MQFYHPEFFYGLFALAIPIIVHLFQLRRFKTEPFTNVVLLKKLVSSSRKSSKLKKWLSLLARLLTILCLVFAFAQPYIPNQNVNVENKQLSIFLDNSYSMNLKGENTSLLDQALEELLENLPVNETFHLATHDNNYRNLSSTDLKSLLYDLDFSANAIDINSGLSKAQSLFNTSIQSKNEVVVLSDFQNLNTIKKINFNKNYNYHLVKYTPQQQNNFSIDTAYLSNNFEGNVLNFKISTPNNTTQTLPVSIYNAEKVMGKFSLNFEEESQKEYAFNLETDRVLNGYIKIEDAALKYDNILYFSIQKPEKIRVLVISETKNEALDRIYNNVRFEYKQVLINQLEYAEISQSDVVILNEIEQFPKALSIAIDNYANTGAVLAIIPKKKLDLISYNQLFNRLKLKPYGSEIPNAIKLTNINFEHPIFKNVFTENVKNFDYPEFNSYYRNSPTQKALAFSNGDAFLESKDKIFRFNAPINENSNFKQSPLIVLSFFNLALQAQSIPRLYINVRENYELKVKSDFAQDQVISLSNQANNYIPRQEKNGQNIKLNFIETPENAGHFVLKNLKNDTLSNLAFNNNRKESVLNYFDIESNENIKIHNSFASYTQSFYEQYKIVGLWKWFIILALVFMIIELLLLRFVK